MDGVLWTTACFVLMFRQTSTIICQAGQEMGEKNNLNKKKKGKRKIKKYKNVFRYANVVK